MANRYRCGAPRSIREGPSVKHRCIGSLHGPLGDCLRPIAGGLLCYGYLDVDQGVPLEDSLEGPRPLLFPACSVHRPALVQWAELLWGDIADGVWIEPKAFDYVMARLAMESDPVLLSPDPASAVRVA